MLSVHSMRHFRDILVCSNVMFAFTNKVFSVLSVEDRVFILSAIKSGLQYL